MADSILIKNAILYNPVKHEMRRGALAIEGSEIVAAESSRAQIVIDAKGCIVTPGLIDFHLHCFTGGSDGASDADLFCLPNGTTTCVDAGTSGSANFESFYRSVITTSVVRVLALLHVAAEGLSTSRHPENQTPSDWDLPRIERLCRKYPEIVGLKVRQGAGLCGFYGLCDEPVVEGVRLAGMLGKKLVVHVNDPNVPVEQIAAELRPGDVYCHMYAGERENILDDSGAVKKEIREARGRGILFDASNGRGNFLFKAAEPAISEGFFPDIISSDNNAYANYRHPLISLPRLLSRYLMLGMKLEDVLDCATIAPARWLGLESLASLEVGTEADIAIFKLKKKRVLHKDYAGEERWGSQVLVPQLTIRGGEIVYSQTDFL